MTYTAKTVKEFRNERGSLAKKITDEFALIDTEINGNVKVVKGDLADDASGNAAFSWQNPETTAIIVHTVIIDITTGSTDASANMNVDVSANATITNLGDTIFDGLDLSSAAVSISNNVSDTGTNGDEKAHRMDEMGGTNDYLNGGILTADATDLVGKYYIHYTTV